MKKTANIFKKPELYAALVLIYLIIASQPAEAQETMTLNLHWASYHFSEPRCDPEKSKRCAYVMKHGFNENHIGGFSVESYDEFDARDMFANKTYWLFGATPQSFDEWSVYGGKGIRFHEFTDNINIGGEAGLVHNYVTPVFIKLVVNSKHFKFHYKPKLKGDDKKRQPAFLALSYRLQFK